MRFSCPSARSYVSHPLPRSLGSLTPSFRHAQLLGSVSALASGCGYLLIVGSFRTVVGNARVAGLEKELGMLTYDLNITLSLFYVTVRPLGQTPSFTERLWLAVHPRRCTFQPGDEENWIYMVVFPRSLLWLGDSGVDLDAHTYRHVLEPNFPWYD